MLCSRKERRTGMEPITERLTSLLRALHLPTIRAVYAEVARRAEKETLSYEQFLLELCARETQVRQTKRIDRLLREAQLPLEKNLEAFDLKRLPLKLARQVQSLRDGSFVDRKENLLAFGNPG